MLGLYVHFPFCETRCPYCDFATDARADIPHDAWADAVVAELHLRAPLFCGPVRTIYFGGGTPGLWRPDCVARVVRAARGRLGGKPEETTLEANPQDADARRLAALRASGVDRLSLGLQTLSDRFLKLLGRRHDARQGRDAVAVARAVGFDNVSCDLMFALPEQTMEDLREDLDALLALRPEHVSAYTLTVEPATPFGALRRAGRLTTPHADRQADMFDCVRDTLEAAGYEHYEISNYARPGRRAIHNTRYWTGVDYLGLGSSAHSRRQVGDGVERWGTVASADEYVAAVARAREKAAFPRDALIATFERLDASQARRERIWLGLRTSDGVARRLLSGLEGHVREMVRAGLLEEHDDRVRLSRRGVLLADEVAVRLIGRVERCSMRTVDPGAKGPDTDAEAPEEAAAAQGDEQTGAPADAVDAGPEGPPVEPTPEERIAALEREKKETYDRLLRAAADLENFRKRARRDVEDAARRAREEALAAMLPVVDNLERALDHADEVNKDSIGEGVRLVHRQLLGALEKFEVRPFDSVGTAFDPEQHDAVGQEETADTPAGAIVREMVRGYRIGDRVLRHAMVTVAKPPTTEAPAAEPAAPGDPEQGDG